MAFFLPFNNQPESIEIKNGSYTIPAGKYARVTASLNCTAVTSITVAGTGSALTHAVLNNDSAQTSGSFWLPTGSAITITTATASGSASGSSTADALTVSGTTSIDFKIDAIIGMQLVAKTTGSIKNPSASGTNYCSLSVSGTAAARYIVELFPELT